MTDRWDAGLGPHKAGGIERAVKAQRDCAAAGTMHDPLRRIATKETYGQLPARQAETAAV